MQDAAVHVKQWQCSWVQVVVVVEEVQEAMGAMLVAMSQMPWSVTERKTKRSWHLSLSHLSPLPSAEKPIPRWVHEPKIPQHIVTAKMPLSWSLESLHKQTSEAFHLLIVLYR